jgi:hypothetical protein
MAIPEMLPCAVMLGGHLVSGLMENVLDFADSAVGEIMNIPEMLPLVVMFGGHLVSDLMENVLEAAVGEIMNIPEILPHVCHVWRPSCFWFDGECS